jgi:hypothetical protein
MAFDMDDANCFCEPDARVRRLCRIALAACGGPAPDIVVPTPEEVPPPAVLELVQPLPSPG